MRHTYQTIADATGVSKVTVSKILAGKTHFRPETIKRVMDYVSENEYKSKNHTVIKAMSPTECAWLAGLIDGEGCISISHSPIKENCTWGRRTEHYRLFVQVLMCHEGAVRRILELTGLGTVTEKAKPSNKNHHQSWAWRCGSKQASQVLLAIHPYSVVKKEEIEAAIEFTSLPNTYAPRLGVPSELQLERIRLHDLVKSLKLRNH